MSERRFPEQGLYAIADSTLATGAALEQSVRRVISGGACMIQYRDKTADADRRREEAAMLVATCRRFGVPMIVNDDLALALETGADGVHIGRDDTPLVEARRRLGREFIIGVSCYDQVQRAERAQAEGADYVAFGSMFPSTTKPEATAAGLDIIVRARRRIRLPIVAIGGITSENGRSLLDAGVDMLAVVSALFAAADPEQAARCFARLFESQAEVERR